MEEPAGRDIGLDSAGQPTARPAQRRSKFTSLALGTTVVVAALVALLIAFRDGPPEQANDIEAPVVVPSATVAPTPPVDPTPVATDTESDRALDQGQLDDLADHDVEVARLFTKEVDDDAVHYGVAYPTVDGLMVLNRSGARVPERSVAQQLGVVSVLPLLTTEQETWAIDPRGDGLTYLVTNNFIVVQSARLNTLAVYNPISHEVELLASGQPAPGVELPEGVEVLPVQRRGLLALPRTGGTYEIDGLAESMRRIDDGRAVAASAGATVFHRCDVQLACELVLRSSGSDADGVGDVEHVVPLEIDEPISLSPSGAWALQYDGERNVMLSTETNSTYELAPGEIRASSWASTGEFVALLRSDMIELFYPHEQRSLLIDVVRAPSLDALTVYSSAVAG